MSCDYQGYEFGAGYLDSVCIDGRLFDADNCDDAGNLYEPSVDLACPKCNWLQAMNQLADDWLDSDETLPRYSAWHLVMDIRRNRGLKTIPFGAFVIYRIWRELTTLDRDWWFRLTRLFR